MTVRLISAKKAGFSGLVSTRPPVVKSAPSFDDPAVLCRALAMLLVGSPIQPETVAAQRRHAAAEPDYAVHPG